jgi:hypothetical protein
MTSPSRSLRCRHCHADNPVDSTCCWLCDAADWNPAVYGAAKVKSGAAAAPADVPSAFDFDASAVVLLLLITTSLVMLGLASQYLGLAVGVAVVWWVTLGIMILRRNRFQPGEVIASLVVTIALAVGLVVLLAVAAFLFLMVVCGFGPCRR